MPKRMYGEPRDELQPFARWFRAAAQAQALGVRDLARKLEMSPSGVSQLLNAINAPRPETLRKIALLFGQPMRDILPLLPDWRMEAELPKSTILTDVTGVAMVPVLDQAAGAGRGMAVLEYEYVSPTIAAKRNVIAVRVRGSCMSPTIEDGDTVVVDRDASWQMGKVVLAIVDDRLLIKRLHGRRNGSFILTADNPDFAPHETLVREEDITGLVLKVIKDV